MMSQPMKITTAAQATAEIKEKGRRMAEFYSIKLESLLRDIGVTEENTHLVDIINYSSAMPMAGEIWFKGILAVRFTCNVTESHLEFNATHTPTYLD